MSLLLRMESASFRMQVARAMGRSFEESFFRYGCDFVVKPYVGDKGFCP